MNYIYFVQISLFSQKKKIIFIQEAVQKSILLQFVSLIYISSSSSRQSQKCPNQLTLESSVSKNISKLPCPHSLAANSPIYCKNDCGKKSDKPSVRPLSEDEERDGRFQYYFYFWVSVG